MIFPQLPTEINRHIQGYVNINNYKRVMLQLLQKTKLIRSALDAALSEQLYHTYEGEIWPVNFYAFTSYAHQGDITETWHELNKPTWHFEPRLSHKKIYQADRSANFNYDFSRVIFDIQNYEYARAVNRQTDYWIQDSIFADMFA